MILRLFKQTFSEDQVKTRIHHIQYNHMLEKFLHNVGWMENSDIHVMYTTKPTVEMLSDF